MTALMIAAMQGHMDMLDPLINNGANLDLQCDIGMTALMYAAHEGHVDMVDRLINNGANLDLQCNDGMTALMIAAHEGHVDIVDRLINNGANLDLQCNNGMTALRDASEQGHFKIVKLLINSNADADKLDKNNQNALLIASRAARKLEIQIKCPEYGWDSEEKETYDSKLEMYRKIMDLLACHSSDVNCTDSKGNTALYYATHKVFLSTVDSLIKNGADVNIQNNAKLTPLILTAHSKKRLQIARRLIEAGANVNLKDFNGNTAAHIAIKNNNFDVYSLIAMSGKLRDIKDSDGKLAKDYTRDNEEYLDYYHLKMIGRKRKKDKRDYSKFVDVSHIFE
jgi:serine/threonine-protein phosphatase 6 regulatory ankyrin repeat subunit B